MHSSSFYPVPTDHESGRLLHPKHPRQTGYRSKQKSQITLSFFNVGAPAVGHLVPSFSLMSPVSLRKSVYSAPRVFLHAITFTLTRAKYEKNRPLPEPSRLQEGNRNFSQRNATNFRDRNSAPNTRAFILFGGGKKTKKLSGMPPSFAMVSLTHKYNNSANEIVFRLGQSVPPFPGRTVNETSTFVAMVIPYGPTLDFGRKLFRVLLLPFLSVPLHHNWHLNK